MSVELKPNLQRFVYEQVRAGRYDSPEEVIEAGLTALQQQDREAEFAPGELDALIAEGVAELDRGESYDGEAVFRELDELSAQRRRETSK
jgi:putative addiction module CopG family antidote